MSLQFNITASPYNGLIQRCEINVYGEDALGRISGNTTLLGLWTTRLNQSKLKMEAWALEADGLWQHDDKSHTDLPTITTNIVADQREYTFDTDEEGNKILEILRVYYKHGDVYELIEPIDETLEESIYDGQNVYGAPRAYGKKGNTIILDRMPENAITGGLKVETTREDTFFTTADTTKYGGYDLFDTLISDLACFEYSRNNVISNVNLNAPYIEQQKRDFVTYMTRRAGDRKDIMRPKKINYI